MPNYKILTEDIDFDKWIKQRPIELINEEETQRLNNMFGSWNVYEVTVTFNQHYWTLQATVDYGIRQCIGMLVKKLQQKAGWFEMDYTVEYQKNGYPHLHAQIFTREELHADQQRSISGSLKTRFGRADWYQTGKEDYVHTEISKETGEMKGKWSNYIRKDLEANNKSGCIHGYTINNN